MPENYRGFYFIKKISLELLDEVYNESVNYNTFLTNAEIKSDLTILPTKILSSFASILLNIESYWFNELDQNHSLYADNSNLFCKRDTVIKLIEQQKYHKDTFILEDKIREFLKLEIDRFTETDKDVLKTINVYNAPDYIMHMSGNKGIVNNRAYRKEDVISIKEFLHVSRNTQYDVKVDNDISSKYPYQTYLIPLEPLGLIRTLEQISKPSADIWDKFVKLQLKFQQCSEKTINIKINQYIKTLNIIINLLQANEVSEFSCLQTGILNRWLKNINSVTYSSILIGFFKFAAIEYISQGKKIKYRYKELKPYNNTKSKPDDLLPEIYSFTEYSKLFNYCNDYYTHIEIAVNEILDYGTCTYASTWFYVMSHLNNAWRSNDFSMFPYIDILDVINRSTNDDVKWFLNNRMTKSDATIIALRIQNNPKVISKTKKYTRFVCSDELLETYTTAYSLLAFYTTEYLSIEIGFIITYL
jgi:integrase